MIFKRFLVSLLILVLMQQSLVYANETTYEEDKSPIVTTTEIQIDTDDNTPIINDTETQNTTVDKNSILTDDEFLNNIFVDVLGCSPLVSYGESLSITIELKNITDTRFGTAQWHLDGIPIPGYYYSQFEFSEGKTYKMLYPIEFTRETGDNICARLDMVIGNCLRYIELTIPLSVYSDDFYKETEKEQILSTVKQVNIDATILYDTYSYSDRSLKNQQRLLQTGENVKFKDSINSSANVILSDGTYAWIKENAISISNKNYTVFYDFTNEEKENFVNVMNYVSKTYYLVWINLERQKVNVFLGSGNGGDWTLIKSFACATGANETPTPEGNFEYQAWSHNWEFQTFYVAPVLYFSTYRGLAFHSRLYNYNDVLIDSTIGTPISHGCIRMYDEDVLWLRQYLPFETAVYVY